MFSLLKSMKAVRLILPVLLGSSLRITSWISSSLRLSFSYAARSRRSYSSRKPLAEASSSPKTRLRSSLVSRSQGRSKIILRNSRKSMFPLSSLSQTAMVWQILFRLGWQPLYLDMASSRSRGARTPSWSVSKVSKMSFQISMSFSLTQQVTNSLASKPSPLLVRLTRELQIELYNLEFII